MKGPDRGYLHPFSDGRCFQYGVGEYPRTLTELAMSKASDWIRSKSNWWTLYHVNSIREKWSAEIRTRVWIVVSSTASVPVQLSEKQVQYVLDELAGYDALRDQPGCEVACSDRIWRSSHVLSDTAIVRLQYELEALWTSRPRKRSSKSVASVDFIDPLLYSFIYGQTLSHSPSSTLYSVPAPSSTTMNEYATSPRFAYIPTPFLISEKETALKATALSYINNVNPDNLSLYQCLQELVANCIPLFERVLTDLHRNNPLRHRIPDTYTYTDWDEPDEPEDSDEEEWSDYRTQLARWTIERPINLPDIPKEGYVGGLEKRQHVVSLRGRTIQVVIRATEIRLAPFGPACRKTPWHVEGMRNDHIVACALYCTQAVNIEAPEVMFRMAVSHPKDWEPEDAGGIWRTWGFRHMFPCHQTLGGVNLCPGIGIAFPNVYQHRFTDITAVDQRKAASMTFLGLFLVDPDLTEDNVLGEETLTPSTSQVPPQQKEWIRDAVNRYINPRLPNEIVEQIVDEIEGLLTEEEAFVLSEQMRTEREEFWELHDRRWFCLPFDSRH
ncbi:hypothetical protein CERSUDRAFT_60433 [Gelatoporia subvermispora B]|uniref:Uncharacterized protein n=1 Tax=Ceriporiopsis subvermispora (strain B) TaxID=914234 RepID=M2Q2V0_CERS8|nr:hypothetical protein CERSUDRAFT_60433 [Gelatoporia subvermispora B]